MTLILLIFEKIDIGKIISFFLLILFILYNYIIIILGKKLIKAFF